MIILPLKWFLIICNADKVRKFRKYINSFSWRRLSPPQILNSLLRIISSMASGDDKNVIILFKIISDYLQCRQCSCEWRNVKQILILNVLLRHISPTVINKNIILTLKWFPIICNVHKFRKYFILKCISPCIVVLYKNNMPVPSFIVSDMAYTYVRWHSLHVRWQVWCYDCIIILRKNISFKIK